MTGAEPDKPRRLHKVALWLAATAGAALIATVVAALFNNFVLADHDPDPPPPPLSTQWLRERAAIAKHGWRIAEVRKVDLRGIDDPSTMIVLDPPPKSCIESGSIRAQQVRIYDVDDGRLERAYSFEPKVDGCPPWEFQFVKIAPLREYDDAPLVIGRFVGGDDRFPEEVMVPAVISWDDRSQQYSLEPLLVRPPRILEFSYRGSGPLKGNDRAFYREAKKFFEHPVDLGSGFRGYAVSGFAFGQMFLGVSGPAVGAVYRVTAGNFSADDLRITSPIVFQRAIWSLETTPEGSLYAAKCSLARRGSLTQEYKNENVMAAETIAQAGELITSCTG